MAFVITPLSGPQPGNVFHFWDVFAKAADVTTAWVSAGFQKKESGFAGDLTILSGGPSEVYAEVYTTDGSELVWSSKCAVEFNTEAVICLIPGYTYQRTNENGQPVTVTVSARAGIAAPYGAWRLVRENPDPEGTVRVCIAAFPGDMAA